MREARNGKTSNPHKVNIIRKLWADGGQVVKAKLAYFDTPEEAAEYERALIFHMDGLVNVSEGGIGTFTGRHHLEETRHRISTGIMQQFVVLRRVRQYRIDLGWSINKLAKEAGITRQAAANAEAGQPIRAETAKALADALSKAYGYEIKPSDIQGLNVL